MNEKQKIFFVYPPSNPINRDDASQCAYDELLVNPILPPVDMMSLSAIAKKRAYETKFHDYALLNETEHDFIRDLRVFKPDFLVLNVASVSLEKDLSILSAAKELLSDTVVIVKGSMFNFNSYSLMQQYPEIDIALRGDIELAFDEIIQYKDFKTIKGITYKIEDKIVSTPDRKISDDLDFLPFLDRDLIDIASYSNPFTKKPRTAIRVSSGCPNHCFFCLATPLKGSIVRYRDIELIVNEIKECVHKYNISDFVFLADIFNEDNKWVQKLCIAIIEAGLKIHFSINTRCDSLDIDTLRLMKKAGCDLISIGVESGNQEILNKMGKKITLAQIEKAVQMIKDSKIQIHAHYILGLPWENSQTVAQTYKFAKKLNTEYATFYTAAVLYGTKYYDYIMKNRLGGLNYDKPCVIPSTKSYELSAREIYEFGRKFNKNYYLRPLYILKMLFKLNSLTKFKSFCERFIKLIKVK